MRRIDLRDEIIGIAPTRTYFRFPSSSECRSRCGCAADIYFSSRIQRDALRHIVARSTQKSRIGNRQAMDRPPAWCRAHAIRIERKFLRSPRVRTPAICSRSPPRCAPLPATLLHLSPFHANWRPFSNITKSPDGSMCTASAPEISSRNRRAADSRCNAQIIFHPVRPSVGEHIDSTKGTLLAAASAKCFTCVRHRAGSLPIK